MHCHWNCWGHGEAGTPHPLAPALLALGNHPENQVSPSKRTKYCKVVRLHSSLLLMHMLVPKGPTNIFGGLCYVPITMLDVRDEMVSQTQGNREILCILKSRVR